MNLDTGTMELLVRSMRWEADGVVSVHLEDVAGGSLPEWTPGSHIDIHLGKGLVRQYSLCGDPSDKTKYRIGVLRDPATRGGSRYVHDDLRPGHLVSVSAPRNNFELLAAPKYVFVAGGIGITPMLPMIAQAHRSGAEWELHYGGRSRETMAFVGELQAYGENVSVVSEDREGVLDLDALIGEPRPDTLVYTCGPEGLLSAVEQRGQAWDAETIRLERFKPKARAEDDESGADTGFTVRCDASDVTVEVGPDVAILDALEGAGVDVPNSCREGMCGSCETRVLRGVPDHRDFVLSTSEQESGATMMICVSRAQSEELVLDL
ncbi:MULTISPECIES: PDR/VanB family oxidoreductase [unclassified Gordonia (in: high G+C Gram-positive bacteria)]|uniref:PDR/VanB family oxidoreductase n=1 Tax=unclassified Gordonia (in: high G+C Gram-positive bacteria) TaxID=2657482 RepID=UPI001F0618D1|nr:PDR/VanB family oxidoreductase [Gordonia sp. PDNC005]